jgi:hypothetical protein
MKDPILWITLAVFTGTAIGFIGAALFYAPKLRRHQKDAWKAAEQFYTRQQNPTQRRI